MMHPPPHSAMLGEIPGDRVARRAFLRRPVAILVIAALTAVAWIFTVAGARDMAGTMRMPGDWSMSMAWMMMPGQTRGAAALMFLSMWEVMMIAMMLPSAAPMALLYRRLVESRRARGAAAPPEIMLLAGYFTVWLGFGVVAYLIGIALAEAAMRSETISRAIPAATGLALVAAGVYQLTPWKQVCLSHCRSPLSFFAHAWREGWYGAFRLGLYHGAYCAACCWAIMLIQLAIGVMNLPLMVLLAGVILIEKLWRHGEQVARVVGVGAIAAGIASLVL